MAQPASPAARRFRAEDRAPRLIDDGVPDLGRLTAARLSFCALFVVLGVALVLANNHVRANGPLLDTVHAFLK